MIPRHVGALLPVPASASRVLMLSCLKRDPEIRPETVLKMLNASTRGYLAVQLSPRVILSLCSPLRMVQVQSHTEMTQLMRPAHCTALSLKFVNEHMIG